MSIEKGKRLLDEVKDIMRLKHYSIHTERSYCDCLILGTPYLILGIFTFLLRSIRARLLPT